MPPTTSSFKGRSVGAIRQFSIACRPTTPGASRPGVQPDRQHPRDVGVCIGDRDTRLEACEPAKAEAADGEAAAIDPNRRDDFRLRLDVQEPEALGHDADDLGRPRIDRELPSNHRRVTAKSPLPVAIRQDHRAAADIESAGRPWSSCPLR